MSDPVILNTLEWDSHMETEQWWGSWQEGFTRSPNFMVPASTEGQLLCVSLLFLVPLVGAKQTFQLEWVWSELKPCQNLFCFLPKSTGLGGGQICLFCTNLLVPQHVFGPTGITQGHWGRWEPDSDLAVAEIQNEYRPRPHWMEHGLFLI